MQVQINGETHEIDRGISVDKLLGDRKINPDTVVVEINGRILNRQKNHTEIIPDEAAIEIVQFVGGG